VVSGIVLSYQFGTNWSRFSAVTGNVLGPLIGYEVLSAFFLEASFLGVLLFGWKRVPPWLHFLSAVIVAGGTALSGFWILSANSWMQYPVGHEVRDGIVYPVDWMKIVFSPTFPLRYAHMMTAAYLTTAFVVLATGARHLLAGHRTESARTMVRMAILMIALTAPLQALIGDFHGKQTAIYQRPSSPRSRRTGIPPSPARSCSSPGRTRRPSSTASRSRFPASPACSPMAAWMRYSRA
jgi:cytochrome d ubiquinol oxidase subunit I